MSRVARALGSGALAVVKAPALIIAVTLAMAASTIPFGLVLGARLQTELERQQPVAQGIREIDPEWWQEFREHAEGLAASFTPTILGAAAPLDNLSSLLDGTRRPLILFVPYLTALLLWAFLWGAVLERFASGTAGFFRAGARTFVPFAAISIAAAAAVLILYFTVHPLLFGVIANRVEAAAPTESLAFSARFVLYAGFGLLLIAISLVADYARVIMVLTPARSTTGALTEAWRFVTRHAGSVVTLYLLIGMLTFVLLIGYSTLEAYGGSRVGGWRGILIAQAYIVARLTIRLMFGASEVRLYQNLIKASTAHTPS